MILKLFAVKDMKAQIFHRPTVSASVAEATRSWELVANESESVISKFPHDFRLFHIGDFNTESGFLVMNDSVADLGSAADFKRKPVEQLPLTQ